MIEPVEQVASADAAIRETLCEVDVATYTEIDRPTRDVVDAICDDTTDASTGATNSATSDAIAEIVMRVEATIRAVVVSDTDAAVCDITELETRLGVDAVCQDTEDTTEAATDDATDDAISAATWHATWPAA